MNITPQVETAEMSEADLDNIAGGLSVGAGAGAGAYVDVASVASVCAGVGAGVGVEVEGVSADVAAQVSAL
ncbi:hypothetical protein SUDANB58_03331 [Streptomyces sp. enrichment culture]|uniref:hypothetical protein n=1 Tax=Streptomyces sp. enrichment culture TaxID=1795815 RepID=UPI003F56FDD8